MTALFTAFLTAALRTTRLTAFFAAVSTFSMSLVTFVVVSALLTATWISADGFGALARDGDTVLVLWKRGDGYVARDLAWPVVAAAKSKNGRLVLKTGDAAPVLAVADNVWPPQTLVAQKECVA